ncbi:hypothetical protein ASPZODRAFT_130645 [Penicilliopsis zonata CBS 506.65]|uniref:Uncharacterized protein n=1 Tax=Penicilliopsis zonata CBS 506.65 TaxID=1073090 RepID=A0A1L9SNE2_9EURO|nr:hypothetical protein ASPZODRAFT_130645 [Penicilliopsis zonata CBS 506.65]OJJ48574.1 hypothetical protein ASPZODRAFT_130645 [Penicilliopsis zonata CBS 506.65]
MKCLLTRAPYSSWRLGVFKKLFDVPHPASYASAVSKPQDASKELSEGPKEAVLRPSELLPQSPVITHPRPGPHKKRKRPPTVGELEELRNNAWAVALASPVRMCNVTEQRIPKVMLDDYHLVQQPGSEKLWILPSIAFKDELRRARKQSNSGVKEGKQGESQGSLGTLDLSIRISQRLSVLKVTTEQLCEAAAGRRAKVTRIIPSRWKRWIFGPGRKPDSIVWREDMPDFVLQQKRKEVVKKMKRVCASHKPLDPQDGAWRVIATHTLSEAVLVDGLAKIEGLERMEDGAVLVMGSCYNTGQSEYPDLVPLPQRQSKVPLFDLRTLLSKAELDDLKGFRPLFENDVFFFKPGDRAGVELLLALWSLKTYVTE